MLIQSNGPPITLKSQRQRLQHSSLPPRVSDNVTPRSISSYLSALVMVTYPTARRCACVPAPLPPSPSCRAPNLLAHLDFLYSLPSTLARHKVAAPQEHLHGPACGIIECPRVNKVPNRLDCFGPSYREVPRRKVWPGRADASAGTMLPASAVTLGPSNAPGPIMQPAPTSTGPRLNIPLRVSS